MPSTLQTIATVTVFDYLYDAQGKPLANQSVEITLAYNRATLVTPLVQIASTQVKATTDANGYWQAALVRNMDIAPLGTTYTVRAAGQTMTIAVPAGAGPFQASAIVTVSATITPGLLPGPFYDTGGMVFNLKAPKYGMALDGSDETAKFALAFADAKAVGGTLYMPPGILGLSGCTTWAVGVNFAGAGPWLSIIKGLATVSGAGNRGLFNFNAAGVIYQGVSIRDVGFDLTATTDLNVLAIWQGNGTAMQHVRINNIAFDLSGVAHHNGLQFEGLGGISGVDSYDIQIGPVYSRNGSGVVNLYLNAIDATASYHDVDIGPTFSRIDRNGVGDDRVLVAANYPSGVGGNADVHTVVVHGTYTFVAAGLTSGLVNGVKYDAGNNSNLHGITFRDTYLWNLSPVAVSGSPAIGYRSGASTAYDITIENTHGTGTSRPYFQIGLPNSTPNGKTPFFRMRGLDLRNIVDPIAGLELLVSSGPTGDESVQIADFSLFNSAALAAIQPIGIMLLGLPQAAGPSGITTIERGVINGFRRGITNNIDESATVQPTPAWTNIHVRDVKFPNVTLPFSDLASGAFTIEDCPGFNPQGVAALAPGASPWTYTNLDGVVEDVLVDGARGAAGTLTVTKNAIIVYNVGNNEKFHLALRLLPAEALVLTYTAGAGDTLTVNKDRK